MIIIINVVPSQLVVVLELDEAQIKIAQARRQLSLSSSSPLAWMSPSLRVSKGCAWGLLARPLYLKPPLSCLVCSLLQVNFANDLVVYRVIIILNKSRSDYA